MFITLNNTEYEPRQVDFHNGVIKLRERFTVSHYLFDLNSNSFVNELNHNAQFRDVVIRLPMINYTGFENHPLNPDNRPRPAVVGWPLEQQRTDLRPFDANELRGQWLDLPNDIANAPPLPPQQAAPRLDFARAARVARAATPRPTPEGERPIGEDVTFD